MSIVKILNSNDGKSHIINTEEKYSKYIIYPGEYVNDMILKNGKWDWDLIQKALEYVEENSIVIDIGANIGAWTIELAKKRGVKVYSFEPQRLIFQQLCGNIAINKLENVYTYQLALGTKEEKGNNAKLHNIYDYNKGMCMITDNPNINNNIEIVKMECLDSFLLENVSLIKIHVEKYEYNVLKGALWTIQQSKPTLFIELFPNIDSTSDIKNFLYDQGYVLYHIDSNDYFAIHKTKIK